MDKFAGTVLMLLIGACVLYVAIIVGGIILGIVFAIGTVIAIIFTGLGIFWFLFTDHDKK